MSSRKGRRRLLRRSAFCALAWLAVVCAAGPAVAERDYDFAKALWGRGYHDLAVEQYLKFLGLEGASGGEKARARIDLAAIYQEQADQAKDGADRQALLARAQAALAQALAEAGQDVVLVFTARQQQALLLQNNARYVAGLLGRPDFEGDRDRTRSEAVKAFDESVTAFQALAKDAEALVREVEKQARPNYQQVALGLQNERVNASLRGLWSEYYAGLLFGEAETPRRSRLERARDGFARFAKDWDGYVVSLYGHLGEGTCWLKLGDHQKAQAKFTLVVAAAPASTATREVRVQALIYRATSFNATDQATAALEDLDGALRSLTQPERTELGRQALLEKAKALDRLAEETRAREPAGAEWKSLLRQALQTARAVTGRPGPYAAEAVAVVTRCLTALGLSEAMASAGEALGVAQAAVEREAYEEAVRGYERAIELAGGSAPRAGDESAKPVLVRAWFGIARCHYYLKHYAEAAIVFEFVAREFPRSAEGPRAAYLAVQCWLMTYSASRQEADRRAGLRSLAGALARYGADPRLGELRLLQGQLLVQERRYEEALRAFQAVVEGAGGYPRAQYEAGMCAWEWFLNLLRRDRLGEDKGKAQYETAAAHLKTFLRLAGSAADEEERGRVANARVVLATIHSDVLGDPGGALAFLDADDGGRAKPFDFPEEVQAQVLPLRLKGLIQQRRVEEAWALFTALRERLRAEPKRFQEALQLMGKALDDQAEALRKKGDQPAYAAAAQRTADFLLGVLRDNPDQDAAMYLFVASRLIGIERFEDAAEVLKQAIDRFGTDPANEAAVLSARLSLAECLMGLRSWPEAIEHLNALAKKYPTSGRLRTLLATCYVEAGQRDRGLSILEDLFRNVYKPGTRPWYEVGLVLAQTYEKAGRRKEALAITSYVKVLYPRFWGGEEPEHLDLAEQYKEAHRRCGGQE